MDPKTEYEDRNDLGVCDDFEYIDFDFDECDDCEDDDYVWWEDDE